MRGLAGKVALITGAGGAIGRALCRRFADAGSIVSALDRNGTSAEQCVEELTAAGGRGQALECDITSLSECRRAVSTIEDSLGPVDVLVNCAGWDKFALFLDSGPELWDEIIAINLRGPLNMHHAVLSGMVERRGGRVVNISSDAARVGSTGESVYSACKGGIISFTKTLARELATQGIRLNAVCPGPTDTPLLHSFAEEGELASKIHASLERAIPLRRLGRPEDIAGIVAFLASDEASFITGQVISVSGGLTMSG